MAKEGKTVRGVHPPMPEKTANWGELPGKPQPKDRSGGTRKVKGHAKSRGI